MQNTPIKEISQSLKAMKIFYSRVVQMTEFCEPIEVHWH